MGRISNTWQLAKISWGVLRRDRELLWIPVLSFLVSAAVLAVVVALVLVTTSVGDGGEEALEPALVVLFVATALLLGVVAVFFNGALVAGAHERMSGGDPTVRSAVGHAFVRIGGLVPWALITTTVGLIIRSLRDRAGWLGRAMLSVVDMAWEVVTFLVVPAIVIDDLGPIEGFKRSASLLRRTWGENLAARVGFGLLGLVLVVPAMVVAGVLVASGSSVLAVVGIVAGLAWLAVVMVVLTALNAVFQTALYMYATTGVLPTGFEQAPLAQTFAHK